jgi:hypothetical protein
MADTTLFRNCKLATFEGSDWGDSPGKVPLPQWDNLSPAPLF